MSSRNEKIHSITFTLLLFGQSCCWGMWIGVPDTFQSSRLVDNEYANAIEVEPQQPFNHREFVASPWTEKQAQIFLRDNGLKLKLHAISDNLRSLLKDNSDDNLPIVYDDTIDGEEGEEVGTYLDQQDVNAFEPEHNQQLLRQDEPDLNADEENMNEDDKDTLVEYDIDESGQMKFSKDKRSGRYNRRYPYKRRNNRYYEQPKTNCKPSREEVKRLLIALHKYQNGNKDRKMVRFCKRDRPLGNIITNMRFLG